MQCGVNLSGLHVPSQAGGLCRCGWVFPPLDLLLLEEQRRELAYAEARARVRCGLAA